MPQQTLEQALRAAKSPVDFLHGVGSHADSGHLRIFADVPDEFTNWRDEQLSWKESCGFSDLSHHMYDLEVEGPDAFDLFADVGANNVSGFEPGQAKQFVACNEEGYLIGDGILFYLDEDRLRLVGYSPINWVQYHLETGDYDATARRDDHGGVREGPPDTFRYQVQGPDALAIVDEALDGGIPDVKFFNFTDVEVDGHEAYALRHGMMDEPGFEIFGPWEHADEVRETLLEVGAEYGMRRIGSKTYPTNIIPTAWISTPVPAVYSESTEDYREWLPANSWEGAFAIGGSFESENITDYYLTPFETGHGKFIDFDHDFIGKDALQERADTPGREKVTLVWDEEDTVDIFASLFRDGETYKFMDLPLVEWAISMLDEVRKDGEPVGIGTGTRYLYFEKQMFTLGVIDSDLAEPGTELTLVWGEGPSKNPLVEDHSQTEVTVTVGPAPYFEDKRKTTDYTAGH